MSPDTTGALGNVNATLSSIMGAFLSFVKACRRLRPRVSWRDAPQKAGIKSLDQPVES